MGVLVKIAAVCVPAALFAGVLKRDSPAMALLIALAAALVVLGSALGAAGEVLAFVEEVAGAAGVSETALTALVKALGLAVASRLTADLCRDAGMGAAASAAELAGAAAALWAALPVMRGVFETVRELL